MGTGLASLLNRNPGTPDCRLLPGSGPLVCQMPGHDLDDHGARLRWSSGAAPFNALADGSSTRPLARGAVRATAGPLARLHLTGYPAAYSPV